MKNKPTILIVDDDLQTVELMKSRLKPYGYNFLTAENGKEAIQAVARNRIDLILLDVLMPGMNGFEVTRYLRANESTFSIPIILLTSLSDREDRVNGIEAGCNDFISKPIDQSELTARIKSMLTVKAYHDHMHNHEQELGKAIAKRTKELDKTMVQLKEATIETICILSMAIEYKGKETSGHIQRTSRYAKAVADKLALDKNLPEAMLYAMPMHDIGNIAIPDYILLKQEALDDVEWGIMKQHTLIGFKMLVKSTQELVKLAGTIALTHHEQWNGKGYPQGLKAIKIPVAGRIAAIADVFDRITAKKQPYSVEQAFRMIKDGKGEQFDPDVVDAFLDAKQEVLSIMQTYKDYP